MDDPDWNDKPLDYLIRYTPGMKLPTKWEHYDRAWTPERAFYVRPNEDTHWSWVNSHRRGMKWRWSGIRIDRAILDTKKMTYARATVRRLIATGAADMNDIPETDHARAETAMTYAVALVQDPQAEAKSRLMAAKMVLDFCRAKPASNTNLTINAAEALLAAIDE